MVLVVDPGQCFSCYSVIAEWLDWRDHHPDEFHFFWAREPTAKEVRTLRRIRLLPDGIIASRIRVKAAVEMLVAGDSVLVLNHVRSGQSESALLKLIGQKPLDQVATSRHSRLILSQGG